MDDSAVWSRAEAFIAEHAVSAEQHQLLKLGLAGPRLRMEGLGYSPDAQDCIQIPLWVHAGVTGAPEGATSLAVVAALLWSGIGLLDDVTDGDRPPGWPVFEPATAVLVGATLISALAPLALAQIAVPAPTFRAMHEALAKGLLVTSAGQQGDQATIGALSCSVDEVEAIAERKSGHPLAMLATMAAQMGQAGPEQTAAYADMARALGTAQQLISDCHDLFAAASSSDLRNGLRTLPIALLLSRLAGRERDRLIALLEQARSDMSAQAAVREWLRLSGALQGCAIIIELYRARAARALDRARPHEAARIVLQRRIDGASLFKHGATCRG